MHRQCKRTKYNLAHGFQSGWFHREAGQPVAPGWMTMGSVYESAFPFRGGAVTFVKAIDCYVLGSRTYEHALELGWPYGDTPAHEVPWFSVVPQDPFIFFGVCEFLGGVGQQARVER